jgi:hypothetical protein
MNHISNKAKSPIAAVSLYPFNMVANQDNDRNGSSDSYKNSSIVALKANGSNLAIWNTEVSMVCMEKDVVSIVTADFGMAVDSNLTIQIQMERQMERRFLKTRDNYSAHEKLMCTEKKEASTVGVQALPTVLETVGVSISAGL